MPSRKTASDRIPDPRAALGRAAEDAAVRHLERLGYEIFARNVRLGGAEIDVIARDGDAIVFVEVRSRSGRGHGGPLETVGAVKQARIARDRHAKEVEELKASEALAGGQHLRKQLCV